MSRLPRAVPDIRYKIISPVSLRVAILIWSSGSQRPIEAAPSTQEKNSSSGTSASEPDHFGTMEIKERSLRTVGTAVDKLSFNRLISAFDSSSSARKRALALAYL